ncbi:MAG: cell division protein FtsQ/DivIB [Acidobacteriota bacterium]
MRIAPPAAVKAGRADRFRRPQRNQTLRRTRRRRFIRRGAWGSMALLAGSTVLAWAALAGIRWLETTSWLAVSTVQLEGIERADGRRIRWDLARLKGRNLLGIDLQAVRRELLARDWMAEVTVKRLFPHTLAVVIHEAQPVAVVVQDGDLKMVDARGTFMVDWSPRLGGLDLPLISGLGEGPGADPSRQVRVGLDILRRIHKDDPAALARLSEVDLTDAHQITLRFTDDPAPVYVGRQNVTANLQHYFAVREDIGNRFGRVEAIDLRWRGRVVVVP